MKRAHRGFAAAPGSGFGFGSSASAGSLSYLAEPPSLAAISDPNVVVSLKNISKKDSTTKAKGLEDLIHYAQSHPFEQDGGVEEALLDVWVGPALSILHVFMNSLAAKLHQHDLYDAPPF